MTGVEFVTHVWKSWGIQALVLLSFTLQVALLILAECRRCIDSGVLRFFAWSAYMAADATAIFVLGHLSVSSMSVGQELMAFWAPFLLMHLGGQDNITAYSIEDNRLWLRHLQTLAVQAAATGYIIYQFFVVGSPPLLRWASAVMFIVGMVKYGERVWALRRAGGGLIKGKNYSIIDNYTNFNIGNPFVKQVLSGGPIDTEAYLIVAQQMLDAPIDLLKERPRFNVVSIPDKCGIDLLPEGRLYKVVELQISLMYDVFYTKAQVMHSSLYGIGIRMLSAVATAVALVLFHLHVVLGDRRHHRPIISYRRVDMVVTYVLVVGAALLETMSLLREMFSSWTSDLIIRWNYVLRGRKRSLMLYVLWKLIWLRRLVHVADWRRRWSWSRFMGQHNLLQVCTRSITSRRSKIARWMEAEDWWNTLAYSWSVPVSPLIEKLLIDKVSAYKYGEVFDSWGEAELKRLGLYEQEGLDWSLDQKIVVWHIATNIYLKQQVKTPMAEAVEVLSNYMMCLLASQTHLLPPHTSRGAYVKICFVLTKLARQKGYTSSEDLMNLLRRMGDELQTQEAGITFFEGTLLEMNVTMRMYQLLQASCTLGSWLVREDSQGQNKIVEQVWMEAVCYAAKRCSAYSHAKQLYNGSDLITVAAILLQHMSEFTFSGW